VHGNNERSKNDLIDGMDGLHRSVSVCQREPFGFIAEADRCGVWRDSGARDMAAWLSIRYGISDWKARRWIAAAHALEWLPRLSEAFGSGEVGVDKVVELARFATPETEATLITWSKRLSGAAIRRKGDLDVHRALHEEAEVDSSRSLSWWFFDGGRRFGLEAELPAAQGAVVARALERLADDIPVMPGAEGSGSVEARRADALLAMCSVRIGRDADPDRATVVVHAPLEALVSGQGSCEIEGGPAIHPEVARRMLCDGRVQPVVEDAAGQPLGVGRTSREPPAWMMRQLRFRDYGCTFPGCGSRRFAQAHHIAWWRHGGRTDLDNLLLVCTFHHKLVHEHGWTVRRDADGVAGWFFPDGRRYRAGPAPPRPVERQHEASQSA
jgi:hypothetical protein